MSVLMRTLGAAFFVGVASRRLHDQETLEVVVGNETVSRVRESGCDKAEETCFPHWQTCPPCGCCQLGSSCNKCEYGYVRSSSKCGWQGSYICKHDAAVPADQDQNNDDDDENTSKASDPEERPGECTDEDLKLMWSDGDGTGPGTDATSWGAKNNECGRANYYIWKGWLDVEGYAECIQKVGTDRPEKLGISARCSMCFAGTGQYGAGSCKAKCMGSWYSKGCLDCNEAYRPTLVACAGEEPPSADPLDERVPWVPGQPAPPEPPNYRQRRDSVYYMPEDASPLSSPGKKIVGYMLLLLCVAGGIAAFCICWRKRSPSFAREYSTNAAPGGGRLAIGAEAAPVANNVLTARGAQ